MRRVAFFVYGVLSHVLFLVVFAYLAGFVGNLLVPKSIDAPGAGFDGWAVLVNASLIGLFAVQHSVMARPRFKAAWTRIVPPEIERSSYVMLSNLVMVLLVVCWRPVGPEVWNVEGPVARGLLWTLFAAGWLMVPLVSLLINHFDLFGTRQVWLYLRGREYTPLKFGRRGFYKYVRHPLYVGWLIAFWATPTMTISHLVFAGLLSAYILYAITLEERDLVELHGETYEQYREEVGGLVPRIPARGKLVRRAGTAAMVLFGLKGVAWLVVGAVGAMHVL